MAVRIGTGLSADPDPREGAHAAAVDAEAGLFGEPPDVAIVFASGAHLEDAEATLDAVHSALAPAALIGCGAGGVLGEGREVEGGTAVAVWAAALDGGVATPFHATAEPADGGLVVSGFPQLEGAAGAILLPDPFSFPTDALLRELSHRIAAVPMMGGIASARRRDGEPALFFGEGLVPGGAVGVRLDDVEVLPCVSQGAAPIGPELTVTAGGGTMIEELAGKPAVLKLREVIEELGGRERGLLAGGLLLGIVLETEKPEYLQGDFLVRGIVDVDEDTGAIGVGAPVWPGQIVRLHARDAASADRDLRDALDLRRQALGGMAPAGALVFSCNGRGKGMFGVSHHDAALLAAELDGAPSAGFFAAGEIGPVGGQSFLHGFTATLAIFPG